MPRGTYPAGNPWEIAADSSTRIEAEDFDTGGEGVAFHKVGGRRPGGSYRPDEPVDLVPCDDADSKLCAALRAGEWLEYTVKVPQSGTYVIRLRTAKNTHGDGKARVLFAGVDSTGELAIPGRPGSNAFTNVEKNQVELSAGVQPMRLVMVAGDCSINWVEVIPATAYTSDALVKDSLDELKIGTRPVGDEWSFGTAGGTVSVQQSPQETTRCLRLMDTSRTAETWVRRTFAGQSQQAGFECRARFGQEGDGFALGLLGGDRLAVLLFTRGNELGCEVGNGEWRMLQRYSANVWYSVKVSLDMKTQTFSVYIDGVQRGDKLRFRNGVQSLDAWQAETPVRTTGTLYLNAVRITER